MIEQMAQWREKIDSMSLRERVLVLLVMAACLVMIAQLLFFDSLLKKNRLSEQEISHLLEEVQKQKNEKIVIEAQLKVGVNREKISQRDQLLDQKKMLDQQIESSVISMIPPELMPKVLEDILSKNGGLRLLSLEDRPATSVIEQSHNDNKFVEGEEKAETAKQALYRHSFVLRLQGTYPATVAYFKKLSALPWRFYWDGMHYQVADYPRATITLEVHTVSMSEEWLGV